MIVVDVNVLAYLLIEGDRTPLARKVRGLDSSWRLPDLWRHEFLNILTTYVRQGGIGLGDADKLWQRAIRLWQKSTYSVDMRQSLALAVHDKISSYDAQYVNLAQSLAVSLVTEDSALQRKFPQLAVSMALFCANEEQRGSTGV